MNWLATWLARWTWYFTLQWMRRPWMRRLHMMPLSRMPEKRKASYLKGYQDQNRLARKIGLKMLKFTYLVVLAVISLQIAYAIAISMVERGWLAPPTLEEKRLTPE